MGWRYTYGSAGQHWLKGKSLGFVIYSCQGFGLRVGENAEKREKHIVEKIIAVNL